MARESCGDQSCYHQVALRVHVPWVIQRARVWFRGENREAVDRGESVAPSAIQDPQRRPALYGGIGIVLPRAAVVEGNDDHPDAHRALKRRQSIGQTARYVLARASGMDPDVVTESVLQIRVQ